MQPSDYLKGIFGEEGKSLPDLAEYKLSFGKYNGLTIPEIAKKTWDGLYGQKKTSQESRLLVLSINILQKMMKYK